jgi:RNA polymerase sigma factor (sigma-70 family)
MTPSDRGELLSSPASVTLEGSASVDWNAAREFLHRQLSIALDRVDPAEIQDLTQEALIGLVGAVRREPPRNLEALMTTIARRTGIDYIRRRRTWSRVMTPMEESHAERPDPRAADPETMGDPKERLAFIVLEFFRVQSAPCYELAEYRFAGVDWKDVGEKTHRSHAAIRKQWERCVAMLRKCAGESDDPLSRWASATS